MNALNQIVTLKILLQMGKPNNYTKHRTNTQMVTVVAAVYNVMLKPTLLSNYLTFQVDLYCLLLVCVYWAKILIDFIVTKWAADVFCKVF